MLVARLSLWHLYFRHLRKLLVSGSLFFEFTRERVSFSSRFYPIFGRFCFGNSSFCVFVQVRNTPEMTTCWRYQCRAITLLSNHVTPNLLLLACSDRRYIIILVVLSTFWGRWRNKESATTTIVTAGSMYSTIMEVRIATGWNRR